MKVISLWVMRMDQNQLLKRLSDGGGSKLTSSIAVADINSDGKIDIVIGNIGTPNQIHTREI